MVLRAIGDIQSMLTEGSSFSQECRPCPARDEMNVLARRIGHDLRAPLRALQILPEWIAEEFETVETEVPAQASEYLDMIKSKASQMDGLLTGLLEYALVANPEVKTKSIDPEAEIKELAQASLKTGTYEIAIDPALSGVMVVQEDFRVLFQHLLTNAVRHHGQGTAYVHIKGDLVNNTAVFWVEDNGPGIEEKFHQSIFEPFTTLKSRDEVQGSGLGLAVVKKIVECWGGEISIRSEIGRSTVFQLQFPAEFSA